jgi:putative tryptophan/tyrosine transport system substrate-binding protein
MRRRQFITLIGGTATWPLAARGQQPRLPVIGLLQLAGEAFYNVSGFRQGLKEAGYIEGQNLAIEYRSADGDRGRLPQLAADLVNRQVRVIATVGSTEAASAAIAATKTIPIVFGYGDDPVLRNHVASLNRPGGNVTGTTSLSGELFGKQLGILHQLLPQAARFGFLADPKGPNYESKVKAAQAAALAIGGTIEALNASTSREINVALARLADGQRLHALLISNDPIFFAERVQVAILAARYVAPAIYPFHEEAEAGGLMSYGPNLADRDRQAGHYVGRILMGERPGDLPILQPTKFEMVINLKTAKALAIEVPTQLLAIADEVIE